MNAETTFVVTGVCLYFYVKKFPPGIAYTYCWLFCCLLGGLAKSNESLAFAFCMGFGLNISWYSSQLVDSLLWTNLIPYWNDYFPHWCTESLIRLGDICLHPIPFYCLIPYHQYVNLKIGIYTFLFERIYFMMVEGQPFGTGCVTNIIYDFRPHLPPRSFLLSQYFTNLGYMFVTVSSFENVYFRVVWQVSLICLFIFIGIIHTDRWNGRKADLPVVAREWVGAAAEYTLSPPEMYALAVNEYSQQLHQQLVAKIEQLIADNKAAASQLPIFSLSDYISLPNLPEGFMLTSKGLFIGRSVKDQSGENGSLPKEVEKEVRKVTKKTVASTTFKAKGEEKGDASSESEISSEESATSSPIENNKPSLESSSMSVRKKFEDAQFILWEKITEVYAHMVWKKPNMTEVKRGQLSKKPSLPSLETLQAMMPQTEKREVARIRSVLSASIALVPEWLQASGPSQNGNSDARKKEEVSSKEGQKGTQGKDEVGENKQGDVSSWTDLFSTLSSIIWPYDDESPSTDMQTDEVQEGRAKEDFKPSLIHRRKTVK